VDDLEYKPHMFGVSETALLLGISKSYLTTLENEHAMYARRNHRGARVYTGADIAVLREMGVGKRLRRLRSSCDVIIELGLSSFGREPHEESMGAQEHARAARTLERQELVRLRCLREGRTPIEAEKAAYATTKSARATGRRPWWRRIFGG
jgi:hypothetical protein